MKIKKFGVYIMGAAVKFVSVSALLLAICAYNAAGNAGYSSFFIWLLLSVATAVFCYLAPYRFITSRADSLVDLVVVDEAGISLKRKNGADEFIPWAEVASIERIPPFKSYPSIRVTGSAGSEISWYTEDTEFEAYVRAQHPELEPLIRQAMEREYCENKKRARRKALKITIAVLAAFFLIFKVIPFIVFYNDPPVDYVTETGTEKYMKVNRYVRRRVKEEALGLFPEKLPSDAQADYSYTYYCWLLGNPNYVLYLSLDFDDSAAYRAEAARINEISRQDSLTLGNDEYIIFDKFHKLDEYFNDYYNANIGYHFFLAVENEEEMRIEYVFALINNEDIRPQELIDALTPLYEADYGMEWPKWTMKK